MSSASYRRTTSDVKLDINLDDDVDLEGEDGGLFTSQSDIEDDSDLDPELYLRQPLVPSEQYRGNVYGQSSYFPGQHHGPAPPPYDSQGETYAPLHHNGGTAISRVVPPPVPDDDETESSPIEVADRERSRRGSSAHLLATGDSSLPPPNPTSNTFRYSSSSGNKVRRRSGHSAYPREIKKTLAAGGFMCANFLATTVSLSIVHERVPSTDPLPDIVLDFFRYQHWALTASEMLLSVQCATAILLCVFHKHRFIILRRLFLLLGLLYGYRAITMFVTVLPVANPNYECDPKLAESGKVLTFTIVLQRAVKILSGFGLSMNGHHVYCGDFIYSGHTMTFVLAYLVVYEYTSRRCFVLHWIVWINAIIGVTLLMMARGHYSIDVIVAYYITTRLWYLYHSMANHTSLQQATSINHFSRIWWWHLFRWFEENVKSGPIPSGFNLPLPKALCKSLRSRSRNLVNETNRLTRNRQRKYKEQEA